ncbi:hypothetical protein GGS23DRAFT_550436 [Durotheca rogersii]|uniref:uncharacterized protein n=1 Tax=Durotheca rogersii TaxID=419775 RepID=UPI00221EA301|nr:uncharacterized protein GGS23DRAFT_550436 [Durotheca rogersii]KAI5867866.1 hypothetical protein GGS23DRAFT_550436 [Durotheca rogersii]
MHTADPECCHIFPFAANSNTANADDLFNPVEVFQAIVGDQQQRLLYQGLGCTDRAWNMVWPHNSSVRTQDSSTMKTLAALEIHDDGQRTGTSTCLFLAMDISYRRTLSGVFRPLLKTTRVRALVTAIGREV